MGKNDGLALKNISDLVRKEIQGIFETKYPTKEQIKKYKKSEAEIKNCKGVKRCNDGINTKNKEKQREDFRIILGLKENDIYERKEYSIIKKERKCF